MRKQILILLTASLAFGNTTFCMDKKNEPYDFKCLICGSSLEDDDVCIVQLTTDPYLSHCDCFEKTEPPKDSLFEFKQADDGLRYVESANNEKFFIESFKYIKSKIFPSHGSEESIQSIRRNQEIKDFIEKNATPELVNEIFKHLKELLTFTNTKTTISQDDKAKRVIVLNHLKKLIGIEVANRFFTSSTNNEKEIEEVFIQQKKYRDIKVNAYKIFFHIDCTSLWNIAQDAVNQFYKNNKIKNTKEIELLNKIFTTKKK